MLQFHVASAPSSRPASASSTKPLQLQVEQTRLHVAAYPRDLPAPGALRGIFLRDFGTNAPERPTLTLRSL